MSRPVTTRSSPVPSELETPGLLEHAEAVSQMQLTPDDADLDGAYAAGDRKAIGEALMRARKGRGLSQRHLERVTKVPQGKISRIERGTARATVTELDELAAALSLTVHVVILRDEKASSAT